MTVCTLASSSSGNSVLVSHKDTHILIDAGISLARIKRALSQLDLTPDDISGVLITHEHSDHISGLPVMNRRHGTRIYTTEAIGSAVIGACGIADEAVCAIEKERQFELQNLAVTAFKTPHDTSDSVGYVIEGGGKRLFFATDLGCVTEEILNHSIGCDVAVIEANHDIELLRYGPYPHHLKKRVLSDHGHLSNKVCGHFAASLVQSGTRGIILAHLSKQNNTPRLAYDTVADVMLSAGITDGDGVTLAVSPYDDPGKCYIV